MYLVDASAFDLKRQALTLGTPKTPRLLDIQKYGEQMRTHEKAEGEPAGGFAR